MNLARHVASRQTKTMQRDRNVFDEAIRSLRYIPRTGWLWALSACGASATIDVAFWAAGEKIGWAWAVPFVALTAAWFAAIYVSAIGILSRQPTYQGYLRFALTSVVLLLPFALALGALFAIGSMLTTGGGLAIFFVGVVVAFVLASLLVSWPMAQSLSRGFVSPIRILKATRGQRASLVFLGFAAAAIGRSDLLPKISEAHTVTEAIAIAIGNGLIGLVGIALTASIAVAAWQSARLNDPALNPSSA